MAGVGMRVSGFVHRFAFQLPAFKNWLGLRLGLGLRLWAVKIFSSGMDGIATSPQLAGFEPAKERSAVAPPSWPGIVLAFAATCVNVGIMWDISWHETIGRDSFWTPAHMMIYLGGVLGGCVGGWLAIQHTFLAGPAGRETSVQVFGARAPLGAWVLIWGAMAMLTSAPLDNWWHNAYGLDVKIISPPHTVLGLGMFGITFGALLLVLTRQNRLHDGTGSGLFIYVGGIFLTMGAVFVMEYTFPNQQHTGLFYEVCALAFPLRLVSMGRAGRISWPATRTAAVYLMVACLMAWVLPLFAAQPKLAPIFNPVTHMVPPPFPMLLIFPALAIDLVLLKAGDAVGWKRVALALVLGAVFEAVLLPVQWFFSEFILSPLCDNWFFLGNHVWDFGARGGEWTTRFWNGKNNANLLKISSLPIALALAAFSSWL